jgi:hypothetical protein
LRKFHSKHASNTFLLEPEGDAPDFMEPLRAYRAWTFKDGRLLSLNGVEWKPGEAMVAKCRNFTIYDTPCHDAPVSTCTCGIYAGKNLEHLVEINYAGMGIHGEVDLWGRVMECELGYRAQYAYPKYFVVPPWLLNDLSKAEMQVALLSRFDVDIYVAAEQHVSRDMQKIMLKAKGESIFDPAGVCQLTKNVQAAYESMKHINVRNPEVGDRLFVTGKGIGPIIEVTEDEVIAMLFNTTICTMLRKEVRWSPKNFHFECTPTSFRTRQAPLSRPKN